MRFKWVESDANAIELKSTGGKQIGGVWKSGPRWVAIHWTDGEARQVGEFASEKAARIALVEAVES